jgi:hypothetical protein
MSPPRKSLLFNRQLINNDGLLIAELAVANSIHYNEATQTVHEIVEKWQDQLRSGQRITIDKVGFLFFDQEKNICFEQDRFFNLLLESYGLGKVHFLSENDVQFAQKTTIERAIAASENKEQKPAIVFDTEKIVAETLAPTEGAKVIEHPALRSKTKVWRYVAAACLLPIAFYSFWLPMRTNVLESGMISVKDFNPFYHSEEGIYEQQDQLKIGTVKAEKTLEEQVADLPEDVEVFSYKFDSDLYIPVGVPKHSTVISVQENETAAEIDQTFASFQYIVGCFGSESNANNLVANLKAQGIDAFIYDESNGLKRISAGGATSEAALQDLITEVKAKGFDGWVLKK